MARVCGHTARLLLPFSRGGGGRPAVEGAPLFGAYAGPPTPRIWRFAERSETLRCSVVGPEREAGKGCVCIGGAGLPAPADVHTQLDAHEARTRVTAVASGPCGHPRRPTLVFGAAAGGGRLPGRGVRAGGCPPVAGWWMPSQGDPEQTCVARRQRADFALDAHRNFWATHDTRPQRSITSCVAAPTSSAPSRRALTDTHPPHLRSVGKCV